MVAVLTAAAAGACAWLFRLAQPVLSKVQKKAEASRLNRVFDDMFAMLVVRMFAYK